jgi:heat shock protein 4
MMEEVWEEEVIPIVPEVDPTKTSEQKEVKVDEAMKEPEENVKKNDTNEAAKPEEAMKEQSIAPPATRIEKRKKLKRTNLTFEESRPLQWSKQELDKANEEEVSMANIDRIVQETADKRNELESYIYDMRDKIISDSHLAPYANSSEKTNFSNLLESTENWLYEDGFDATKSVYSDKCIELHKLGDPIDERKREADGRPQALSSLQGSVEHYQNWLNTTSSEEQYFHISEEELNTCRKKCDETSTWMYQKMDEQGNRQLYETPAVTVNELNSKRMELVRVVNPIMSKPQPVPKTEEPKGDNKDEGANTETKPGDADINDKSVDMETDDKEKPTENMNTAAPMDTSV